MSTEIRTLGDFVDAEDEQEILERHPEPKWQPQKEGRCENCDKAISKDLVRVYGDENGLVPGCSDCLKQRGGNEVSNDARAIALIVNHEDGEVGRR